MTTKVGEAADEWVHGSSDVHFKGVAEGSQVNRLLTAPDERVEACRTLNSGKYPLT